MTDEFPFPPLHDLPPEELKARKRHLISEIEAEPQRARISFALPRRRVVGLTGATAVVAACAALAVVLTGSSGAKASVLRVQAIHGPNWRGGTGTTLRIPSNAIVPASSSSSETAATEITGGTDSERALMQTIINGMQSTAIESIEIDDSAAGVGLHITAPDDPRAQWEEALVAAAFRDRAHAAGDNSDVLLYAGDANGASLPLGPTAPLPSAGPGDAAAAKERFENAAAKVGASLDNLTIYQPDGVAVAATLKSDDPASFLTSQMPTFLAALGNRWNDFDGTYVSLVDANGQTVWETTTNGRLSEGSVGSSPDLAACSPVPNNGPPPGPGATTTTTSSCPTN